VSMLCAASFRSHVEPGVDLLCSLTGTAESNGCGVDRGGWGC
jgi:hypothetical protein